MPPQRPKQSKELQKAIADREKRVEHLASFIVLAFSQGRGNQNETFETALKTACEDSLRQSLNPLILEAGLFDSRESLLLSIINGTYDPLARKLQKTLSKNASEDTTQEDLEEIWFDQAVVTDGDSPEDQMAWLKTKTPDVWHIVLDGWNFDYELDWNWFALHPDLDAGTAANFFIPSAVNYLSGEFEDSVSSALHIIAKRWTESDFKTRQYKVSKDFASEVFWKNEYFKAYDALESAGTSPVFPKLESLWEYKGQIDPITPYQQEHSIILQRYDLWLKSLGNT